MSGRQDVVTDHRVREPAGVFGSCVSENRNDDVGRGIGDKINELVLQFIGVVLTRILLGLA